MNRLPVAKRAQILSTLCEGSSMRSVSRLADVSINTVTRELVVSGSACMAYHDRTVINLDCKRLQADEIWSFVAMKAKNVPANMKARTDIGDVWTWTVIDADTKLIPCWLVGPRDAASAYWLMKDLESRLRNKVQMTTDGLKVYLTAIEERFGRGGIDYAILQKRYGKSADGETRYSPAVCIGCDKEEVFGEPDPEHISTSYVERSNLTMRMSMRRFTRLTNAFSKKFENHCHMIALYTTWYNFCRIHKTLRTTPAMAAGVTDRLMSMEEIVSIADEWEAAQPHKQVGRKPKAIFLESK